jgi:hypothetical protein
MQSAWSFSMFLLADCIFSPILHHLAANNITRQADNGFGRFLTWRAFLECLRYSLSVDWRTSNTPGIPERFPCHSGASSRISKNFYMLLVEHLGINWIILLKKYVYVIKIKNRPSVLTLYPANTGANPNSNKLWRNKKWNSPPWHNYLPDHGGLSCSQNSWTGKLD